MKRSTPTLAILGLLLALRLSLAAADPVLVASWPGFTRIHPESVVVRNQRAYIGSARGGAAYDVSDPTTPRQLTAEEFATDPVAPLLTRQKVYELAWPLMAVATPDFGYELRNLERNGEFIGYIPGYLRHSIAISGTKAFVANWENWSEPEVGMSCVGGGNFFIYDISDPSAPVHLSGRARVECSPYITGFPRSYNGAAAEGDIFASQDWAAPRLYDFSSGAVQIMSTLPIRGSIRAMKMRGGFLYCASAFNGGILSVVDVRDVRAPQRLAEIPIAPSPNSLWFEDGFVYVTDPSLGLQVIDARDPAAPRIVATLETSGGPSTSVTAIGQNIFVADGLGGVRSLLHEPSGLSSIGRLPMAQTPLKIRAAGKTAYAVTPSGLILLDIANASAPSLLGSYAATEIAEVAVSGTRAYLSRQSRGIEILDVSNPAAVARLGAHAAYAYAGLLPIGDYLYASGYPYENIAAQTGVHVLNIADPAAPAAVTRLDILTPRAITKSGDFAYVAAASNGWAVVEVRFPGFPAVLARHSSGRAWIERVIRSGDRAYVLDRTNQRLDVYNVADIYNPVRVGRFSGLTDAHDFTLSGFYAYIADGVGGVKALRLPDETARLEWIVDRRFRLTGPDGLKGRVLRSFDLTEWSLLQEIELSAGSAEIADAESAPQAFYTFISP